ncbi:hypothetical protein JCM11251_001274 [Rhodosporidiobolus azoricus]
MAYYLDPAFDSFTSFQPTSGFDDPTTLLSAPEFDLDSTIFSDPGPIPSRTSGPPGSSSNYTHFPEPLQSLPQPPTSSGPLNASTTSNSFPLYDPDSPFNSPAPSFSVKGLTKDGRLKTRLMGIGSDGGFLTSPLIVGKPRVDSRTGRVGPPEISIDSPAAPGTPQASLMTPGDSYQGSERTSRSTASEMAPSLSTGSTISSMGFPGGSSAAVSGSSTRAPPTPAMHEPTGLGMGISGVPDLQQALETGDYGNPDPRIYGMSKNPGSAVNVKDGGEASFPQYQEQMPAATLRRSRQHLRYASSGYVEEANAQLPPPPPQSANRFVEHRFRHASSSYQQSPQQPAQLQRSTRPLPARTINKAKSCSALAASARDQARATYEPLTPTSHNSSSFLVPPVPSAPFNSPHDVAGGPETNPNNMPFSFSDLYNLGLTVDPALGDAEAVKRSPYEYAEELLVSEPNANGAAGLGVGIGLGMGVTPDQDLSFLHALPNAPLATASALSSPSTPYLSDPSPEMGSSAYQSNDELSSAAMFAASSIESTFSNASTVPPLPQSAGRQRCATYGGGRRPPPIQVVGEEMVDPALLSPQHQPRQRQVSSAAAYGPGSKNYSYPTRYTQHQQQPSSQRPSIHQQLEIGAPQMGWSASQAPPPMPPMPPSTPTHRTHPHQRSHTGPPASAGPVFSHHPNIFVSPEHDSAYDRNLADFDSLYEQYEEQQAFPTPTKRGRVREAPVDEDDEEDEAFSPEASYGTRAKRLRTVASAPCLPARRMRPGPKPKNTKSPQDQHQSVFSATLSPPIPQIRRGSSPYASPLLSDDEGDARFPDRDANGNPVTAATITYTPGPAALPGLPRSSVPKEVIQSLYSGIPSHTANGVKVPKRYVCLIEGCDRTFPRKSAIESHIQTHLEDKPFVCPHDDCDASFVRQHDLRRHERIHSGNKPFPCPCGKGFARGDALARHRARGICSGSIVPRRG